MSAHRLRTVFAALLLCLAALPALAAGGKFQFVFGEVTVTTPGGGERRAERGMAVQEGDTITSSHDSQAQIVMDDGGVIAVRPGTSFRLKVYQWNGKEDGSERGVIELLRGALRSITGSIGKTNKDRYALTALTATIGVRGTDHETVIVPRGQGDAPGVYNTVYSGATVMRTPQGAVDIKPGQVGFVPLAGGAPRLAPPPAALRSGPERAGPRGAAKGDAGKGDAGKGDAGKADAGKGGPAPGGRPQQPGTPGAEMRPPGSGSMQPMTQPMQPGQPMQPTQPTQPMQPMQPIQPLQPMQPIQPTQPNQPLKPPLTATQPANSPTQPKP